MDGKQRRRASAAAALMSLLRSADVRNSLRHPADLREHHVVVALDDDDLRYICERVHASGGSATVAVAMSAPERHFRLITMDVSPYGADREHRPADDDLGRIDGGSPVSMALEYMENARLRTMSWHLTSPDCTLEVVDSGAVEQVGA